MAQASLREPVPRPVQWLFLIRSLDHGGSQRQLVELLKGMSKRNTSLALVTFYEGGAFQRDLEGADVPIYSLDKKRRWDILTPLYRLLKLVRRLRPVGLHGYLSAANVLTVVAKVFWPRLKIVWAVRASNMELWRYGRLHRVLFWLECKLSRFADLIIANSQSGRDYAVAHGFPENKMVIVHNGIDVQKFCPDQAKGADVRFRMGIHTGDTLIGLVGRLDPMKGHETFLRAASLFEKERPGVRFVCAGEGQNPYKARLQRFSEKLGMRRRVLWLEAFDPIEHLYNALDMLTSSSSYGEGFPNVIAEAMACGITCVATDVGDSKVVIGNTGFIVSPRDPEALVSAWRRFCDLEASARASRGKAARERIIQNFCSERLVDESLNALRCLEMSSPFSQSFQSRLI